MDDPVDTSNDCCGMPEMGVCPECPDPETVAWGKAIQNQVKDGFIIFAGSQEAFAKVQNTLRNKS